MSIFHERRPLSLFMVFLQLTSCSLHQSLSVSVPVCLCHCVYLFQYVPVCLWLYVCVFTSISLYVSVCLCVCVEGGRSVAGQFWVRDLTWWKLWSVASTVVIVPCSTMLSSIAACHSVKHASCFHCITVCQMTLECCNFLDQWCSLSWGLPTKWMELAAQSVATCSSWQTLATRRCQQQTLLSLCVLNQQMTVFVAVRTVSLHLLSTACRQCEATINHYRWHT